MENVVIGIDLGGTTTTLGIVNRSGTILWSNTFPTQSDKELSIFLEQINQSLSRARIEIPFPLYIHSIGVGAPAANARTGELLGVNLKWGKQINFQKVLSENLTLPVVLDNDANASAIGEMYFGAAKHLKDFILITLGTGLGSGIVVNQELVYGSDGLAGELGHISVDMNGRDCNCGRKGCLETYVSATGIRRTAFELMAQRCTPSILRDLSYNQLTAQAISDAAHSGDAIAKEAFELTGKILGLKLADAIAYTSPEAFILFGGLANAGNLIFEPTARYLKQYALLIYRDDIPVLSSSLTGSDAAVLGAAALAWQHIEKKIYTSTSDH